MVDFTVKGATMIELLSLEDKINECFSKPYPHRFESSEDQAKWKEEFFGVATDILNRKLSATQIRQIQEHFKEYYRWNQFEQILYNGAEKTAPIPKLSEYYLINVGKIIKFQHPQSYRYWSYLTGRILICNFSSETLFKYISFEFKIPENIIKEHINEVFIWRKSIDDAKFICSKYNKADIRNHVLRNICKSPGCDSMVDYAQELFSKSKLNSGLLLKYAITAKNKQIANWLWEEWND